MNIFRFWVEIQSSVRISGESKPIRCFGRSNLSLDDAYRFAQARAAFVQRRIDGQEPKNDPDYVADIREEIVMNLGASNIVTRNRYGAEVLNSSSLCFIDIDSPAFELKYIFRPARDVRTRKERILAQIRAKASSPHFSNLGFRVYETASGFRLLVTGKKFEPRGADTAALMKRFHCDPLYAILCRSQNCYRARISPKSYRMAYKGHRVQYPRTDQVQENRFQAWLAGYELARRSFATCRFIENIGPVTLEPGVAYHDQKTGAFTSLPLA